MATAFEQPAEVFESVSGVEPSTPELPTFSLANTLGRSIVPGKLYNIDPKLLHIPDTHTRSDAESDIDSLVDSVQAHGVIQPVIFRIDPISGRPVISVGVRRTIAAIKAGCTNIPCICTGEDSETLSLVENIQRTDLTAIQLAEGLDKLRADKGYSVGTLALVIGKSKPTVSEVLSITNLPLEMRDKHRNDHDLPTRKLVELAKVAHDCDKLKSLYDRLMNNASRDELRAERNGEKPVQQKITRWVDTGLSKIVTVNFGDVAADQKPEIAAMLKELIAGLTKKLEELGS